MEETRAGYRILIADDDANVHQSLNTYFRREGYQVLPAYDGEEALSLARNLKPDMVILDPSDLISSNGCPITIGRNCLCRCVQCADHGVRIHGNTGCEKTHCKQYAEKSFQNSPPCLSFSLFRENIAVRDNPLLYEIPERGNPFTKIQKNLDIM